jgi:hypothetical protein
MQMVGLVKTALIKVTTLLICCCAYVAILLCYCLVFNSYCRFHARSGPFAVSKHLNKGI